jgi:hypothetical protein
MGPDFRNTQQAQPIESWTSGFRMRFRGPAIRDTTTTPDMQSRRRGTDPMEPSRE